MIKLLVKWFITDSEDVKNNKVRGAYGILGGILGIICNLILFIIKISIGAIMGSIAIISDAFNNLSDTGSSLISIIGAKLSNKKPDREHPFGHGRFEYISSLIVSFIIMLVGFELLKTSIGKIFNPQVVELNFVMLLILTVSVLLKVWMYSYNKYLGRKIDSGVLLAASKDSLNDAISTIAVITATIIAKFTGLLWLDSLIGVIVSILIMKSGFDIARDTIDILLGTQPDVETVDKIIGIVSNGENIVGVHDLIVHDYGPGRVMASVHAEVPDNADITRIHEIIDMLENKIENDMGIHMVIHMDPISVNCERTKTIRELVVATVKGINPEFNIHDFRMTDGEDRINLIFDLEIPVETTDKDLILAEIDRRLKEIDKRYYSVIKVDNTY